MQYSYGTALNLTMVKKKSNNDGQATLFCFSFSASKETEKESEKKGKENAENMGLDSNLRKSSIKRCKQAGASNKKKNTQKTIEGKKADGRCDEGTKICVACSYKEKRNKNAHFAHDPTCTINVNYKKTNGGRITMADYYLMKYEEERKRELNRPFSGTELHTGGNKQEEVDEFFLPRGNFDEKDDDAARDTAKVLTIHSVKEQFDTSNLIERINYHMNNPTNTMRRSQTVPLVVAAAIQSLLNLIPNRWKSGTNELAATSKHSATYKKLQAYRKIFPPGTIGFKFPKAAKNIPPDHYYSQLEDRTFYFVCWELNIPGWQPTCYDCGALMIHDQYDFQSHGYATPIFNICGTTDYAVSMYYNCTKCDNRCKANDGRMLMNVDLQFRNGYPVDPRYAVGVKQVKTELKEMHKETHLHKTFTRVMDKMFITHGNGDQLAIMLNELRADSYLDREEEFLCQNIDTGRLIDRAFPQLVNFNGRYSPSGAILRDMKDSASSSDLVSTGVSDRDRVRREIQSVGCNLNSSSDHTWEFLKNYENGALPDDACGHTMGTNRGEIASIAIVKSTKQAEYAHQAEQCTQRENWNPKVHTTDNCPVGVDLWKVLINGVHCQLGLFHFTYRITKTLNKECDRIKEGINDLSECLYYYEEKDLKHVERCLLEGKLGTVKGEKCAHQSIKAKAKTYRENVRIWMYHKEDIHKNLAAWIVRWRDVIDDKGERLFSEFSSKTVFEQMTKLEYIVDTLTKDELYLEVDPSLRSTTGLKLFVGSRGSESKLEKGHHAIAHFANTGMRWTLADFLGMGGIAIYNLQIRHRFKLYSMKPKDRAKVPVAFQSSPSFTNHLRLSHNNQLGRKAGLKDDLHKDVEILQRDNGEKFMYEYYLQQLQREKEGIGNAPNNRCLCRDCGRVNNPYKKRKPQWRSQQDAQLPTKVMPAVATLSPAPPVAIRPKLPHALMNHPAHHGLYSLYPQQQLYQFPTTSNFPQQQLQTNVGLYSDMVKNTKRRINKKKKKD